MLFRLTVELQPKQEATLKHLSTCLEGASMQEVSGFELE